jgi:phage tail protein X
MCWLVSQVAVPMTELPTPLVVRGPQADSDGSAVLASDAEPPQPRNDAPLDLGGRFARPSPVEVAAAEVSEEADTLILASLSPQAALPADQPLPPPYIPEATVLAMDDGSASGDDTRGGHVHAADATPTTIPVAFVSDDSPPPSPVLAAPVDDSQPVAAAAPVAKAATSDPLDQPPGEYKVRRGDSLMKIVRRTWGSDDPELLDALLAANPGVAKRRNRIFPGEVLTIPDVRVGSQQGVITLVSSAGSPSMSKPAAPRPPRWYTIRERDTLVRIARRLLKDGERWREIAQLNDLRNAHRISPGMRIKLPPLMRDT